MEWMRDHAEITRLRNALFKIQCDELDRATDTGLNAQDHRMRAMKTRDEIIEVLNS